MTQSVYNPVCIIDIKSENMKMDLYIDAAILSIATFNISVIFLFVNQKEDASIIAPRQGTFTPFF